MSVVKTIGLVLGTIVGLLLIVGGGVAFLIYVPANANDRQEDDVFKCPEEQYTVMCVLRGYLVPSTQRH